MTPAGSFGKVFGFVTTGFNVGGVIGPLFFGWLMDRGEPRMIFMAVVAMPVPNGLVRMRPSPGFSPPLRNAAAAGTRPLTAKPSASSAPSLVCPPTSAQPASRSTSFAPAIIAVRSASILLSIPKGTVAIASAVCGSPPMA